MIKKANLLLTLIICLNIIFLPTDVFAEYTISPTRLYSIQTHYNNKIDNFKPVKQSRLFTPEEIKILDKYSDTVIPVYYYSNEESIHADYNSYSPVRLAMALIEKQTGLKFKIEIVPTDTGLPYEKQLNSLNPTEFCIDLVSTNITELFSDENPEIILSTRIDTSDLVVTVSEDNEDFVLEDDSVVGYDSSNFSIQLYEEYDNRELKSYTPEEANVALKNGELDFFFSPVVHLPSVLENSTLMYRSASTQGVFTSLTTGCYSMGVNKNFEDIIPVLNKCITSEFVSSVMEQRDYYNSYVKEHALYTSLTSAEIDYLNRRSEIDVYYNESRNILFNENNKFQGFIPDLMNSFARLTGIDVNYITPVEMSISGETLANNPTLNVISIYDTEVAEELISKFKEENNNTYKNVFNVFAHDMEIIKYYSSPSITKLTELQFANIATLEAFKLNTNAFIKKYNLATSEIKYYSTEAELIDALVSGEVDYALMPMGTISYYSQNVQYAISSAYIKPSTLENTDNELWTLMVHDTTEEDTNILANLLSKTMSTVDPGTLADTWFPSSPEHINYNSLHSQNSVLIYLTILLSVASLTAILHFNKTKKNNVNKVSKATATDTLTGLKNIVAFERNRVSIHSGQFIVVHLMQFKHASKTYGFKKMDSIIISYAQVLSDIFGKDNIYRVASDKFYIILNDENVDLYAIVKNAYEIISNGVIVNNRSYNLTAVIAGADIEIVRGTDGSLVRLVDDLAYECGHKAKDCFAILDQKEFENSLAKNAMKDSLYDITSENVLPFFQPFVDAHTLDIKGCEVLARLQIDGEIIPAYKFIDIADKIGTLGDIDKMLLEKTIALRSNLLVKGIIDSEFYFSVNFSAQFLRKLTYEDMYELARRYNIRSFNFLQIEILEEELTIDEIKKIRRIIHEFNLSTAIDDFSTGHSTISRLNNFKFDVVKMDRSLLPIDFTELDKQIYLSLISMVSSFCSTIIVEGVETAEHVEFLRTTNVSTLQGFFFAKPLSKADFINFVMRNEVKKLVQ